MTGYGYKKSYINANLQGANLDGANLNEANLKQCNLNDASLRATNLEWTNLTQVSAINANFTHCNLTGACIEAWNIDQTTVLDNVDCNYLFLLEKPGNNGTRERRPHDPNKMFQPGDFEELYREIINTVQLFLKNGINPEAFKMAFDKIIEENPNISYDNIQQIPDNTEDGKISIKQLLSQLKTAIETEENLKDETKAEILDSVNNITEAAKNPEDSNLKKLAKLSKNAILWMVSSLPTATKLVTECNELLPQISQLLGL